MSRTGIITIYLNLRYVVVRGFLDIYRDSVHSHDTRTDMLGTEASFATALLRL